MHRRYTWGYRIQIRSIHDLGSCFHNHYRIPRRRLVERYCAKILRSRTLGIHLLTCSVSLQRFISTYSRSISRKEDAQFPTPPFPAPNLPTEYKPYIDRYLTCIHNVYTFLKQGIEFQTRLRMTIHTLNFLRRLDLLSYFKCFSRMNDINDSTWTGGF